MGDHMGLFKFVAVAALAIVPFIFVKEERDDEVSPEGRIVDSDEIFELELNGYSPCSKFPRRGNPSSAARLRAMFRS